MGDRRDRTLYCGNLSDKVTESLLYELFLQAGPLESVRIPKDTEGHQRNYAFVTFIHDISVPYTVALMQGISLFGKPLRLNVRTGSESENNNYLETIMAHKRSQIYSSPPLSLTPRFNNPGSSGQVPHTRNVMPPPVCNLVPHQYKNLPENKDIDYSCTTVTTSQQLNSPDTSAQVLHIRNAVSPSVSNRDNHEYKSLGNSDMGYSCSAITPSQHLNMPGFIGQAPHTRNAMSLLISNLDHRYKSSPDYPCTAATSSQHLNSPGPSGQIPHTRNAMSPLITNQDQPDHQYKSSSGRGNVDYSCTAVNQHINIPSPSRQVPHIRNMMPPSVCNWVRQHEGSPESRNMDCLAVSPNLHLNSPGPSGQMPPPRYTVPPPRCAVPPPRCAVPPPSYAMPPPGSNHYQYKSSPENRKMDYQNIHAISATANYLSDINRFRMNDEKIDMCSMEGNLNSPYGADFTSVNLKASVQSENLQQQEEFGRPLSVDSADFSRNNYNKRKNMSYGPSLWKQKRY